MIAQQKIEIQDHKIVFGKGALGDMLLRQDDGEYRVELSKWKRDRSLRQNNTLWMWIQILADEMGYRDKNELYDALIDKFAPIYTAKGLDGKPIKKRLTSSRMNVEQMSNFLDAINQLAAEFNINLPQPDEL